MYLYANSWRHTLARTAWILSAYLRVADAPRAIDFYSRAFGAKEIARYPMPDGTIGHAELDVHGNLLCLADSNYADVGKADSSREVPVMLYLTVPDVDAVFAAAIAAGATVSRPLADQEYGHRNGGFVDPFGHLWYVTMELSKDGAHDALHAPGASS